VGPCTLTKYRAIRTERKLGIEVVNNAPNRNSKGVIKQRRMYFVPY